MPLHAHGKRAAVVLFLAVIQHALDFLYPLMQGATERHIEFPYPATDTEQRQARCERQPDQRQRGLVALRIVGGSRCATALMYFSPTP